MKLIDKDALVAEIENIRKHYIERDDFDNGWNFALDKVLSFIDTQPKECMYSKGNYTDKVQKIREEVEKLHGNPYYMMAVKDALAIIDSLQEEPSGIKSKCMYTNDNYTDEDRKVLCDGCEEDCKYNKKEPVSDDLEKIVEEIAEPTILNAYGTKELARRLRNTISGISISDDLEEASKEWLRPQLDKSYANYGETKMMELTHFDGYAMLDAIEFGANWQKQKDSIPVSEDLGEYINELSKQFPEVSFAKLSRIAVRVAKWQKQQFEKNRLKHCDSITNEQAELEQKFLDQHLDKHQRMPTFLDAIEYGMRLKGKEMQSTIELAEDHAMLAGMEKMKEEMMANAIDAHCFGFQGAALFSFRLPASNYLVGSEVKVIVIKK